MPLHSAATYAERHAPKDHTHAASQTQGGTLDHSAAMWSTVQGGTTGEYYHMTSAQHTTLASIVSTGIANSNVADGAAIDESKLNLNYSTHAQQHDIDGTDDHNGVSGATEDNFIAFNANGLPKDSGKSNSDYVPAADGTAANASALAGTTPSAFALTVLDDADAATARATLSITSEKLDDFTTPDDNTDLDATTSYHGLLPKLGGGTTNYLRADGTWAQPPGTGGWDGDIADINLDDGTDIGAALADADLILVDDGAGGTNRKCAMSRVKTYVQGIKLDDFTTPDDNTDLNASTSAHGLCPKGDNDTTHYLRGDLTWNAVSGGLLGQQFASDGTAAETRICLMQSDLSALTLTMPGSPNAYARVSVYDIGANATTNNITIQGNGASIDNDGTNNFILDVDGGCVDFMYDDDGTNWFLVGGFIP